MSSADAASLNFWSFLYSVVVWLVALGVVMEGCEIATRRLAQRKQKRFIGPLQQPVPELQTPHWAHNIGDIGFLILVAALIFEPICHSKIEAITGRENRRLTAELTSTTEKSGEAIKQAGMANERASTNELAARQLETQLAETKMQLAQAEARLIELRNENSPMDIGDQQSLADALKLLPEVQVKLRSALDSKAQRTAEELSSTFAMAGWPVIDRRIVGDLGREGVLIGYNEKDITSTKAAYLFLKHLIERNVPCEMLDHFRVAGVTTNEIIVAVMQRPIQLKADLMAVTAKEELLRNQDHEIRPRIFELMLKKFAVGSKELADAQEEFNGLNSRSAEIETEKAKLSKDEKRLSLELEKQIEGTNSIGKGVHVFHSGDVTGFLKKSEFGTNSTVIMRNMNLPKLE